MNARIRLALLAILVPLTVPWQVAAQPLGDRVPAGAVVYFGWTGSESMGPGYEASHLKAILDRSNLKALSDQFIPQVMNRIAQEAGGDVGPAKQIMADVASPMLRHPTAFYTGGVVFREGGQPLPRAALLCRPGDDAAAMLNRLTELVAQAPKDVPLRVAQVDDLVVLSLGFDRAEQAVAANGKSLAADAGYRASLANVHKEPLLAMYVDFAGVLTQVDAAVAKFADPAVRDQWKRARDISGLGGLKRIILTEAFEGQRWGSRGFIEVPEPRKGLLTVFDDAPLSDAALATIPRTSTIVGAGRFDLGKFFQTVRGGIKEFDPRAGEQLDRGLASVRDAIGLDVQNDVLAPLGDEWVYYTDPLGGAKGALGMIFVNRLKDPKKAESSLGRLQALANGILAQQLKDAPVRVAFKQGKVGNLTVRYLAIPFVSPGWAVADGNLYVGLFPQTIVAAAEHVRTKSPSILQNEAFAAARKEMGGGRASGIQFIDLPRTAPDAYPGWLMISRLVGFGDLFGIDAPPVVGPPLKTLMAHLTPAVTVTWSDQNGWYAHTRQPFPGSTLLGSDPIGGSLSSFLPVITEMMNAAKRDMGR